MIGEVVITEGKVGSKGELFPPKSIREKLGLKPHMKVIYKVKDGRLIVEPIHKLEDVIKAPQEVEISLKEFHKFRKELSKEIELRSHY